MASFLDTAIQNIKYFGPAAAKKLARLKIKTVGDLLYHFPFRYDDFSNFTPISALESNTQATIRGAVASVKNINIFKRRMTLTEAVIEDGAGNNIKSIWFNQPYLLDVLKPGRQVNLSGKVALNKKHLCLSNPAYEFVGKDPLHTGRLVPVYPETRGLTSRWLRSCIKPLLRFVDKIPDILPDELKKIYRLPNLNYALSQIHFPDSGEKAETAKRRFAFEELFILQLFMGMERLKIANKTAPMVNFDEEAAKKFVAALTFELTEDQKKSAWQIIQDMQKNRPMNRLLEGDVGSGKTIVAAMAAYLVALSGQQAAFMAPTEILGRQHYEKIWPLFNQFGFETGLMTSSETKLSGASIPKKELIKKIEAGQIPVVIGTHSLIQKNVTFKNLALVVIDEQHRFGVNQRAKLLRQDNGLIPHLLSMSATPIPRTLGLTVWGDLDLSLIKELPKGRKNITTKIIPPPKREWAYDFIKSEIKNGRQAFVICPLVEESEKLPVKAATKEYERLQKEIFPELKIGLLHGRLKPKEKEKIMAAFLNKEIDILAATSVVEVGIDIPNATVMMIEGADRFGLASLYQFRGRVGRGEHQSHCFLLTDSPSAATNERLKAIETAQSGFDLAERDLELRGPGDFVGIRQSGLPDLAIASLTNLELIQETHKAAKKILIESPSLKNSPLLAAKVTDFQSRVHFE